MPHQCTTCGHVFDDGSKEMLSGCPDCGENTFQFHPKGTDVSADPPEADPPEPEGSSAANTVGRAATKVRDLVSSDDGAPEPDSTADPAGTAGPAEASTTAEPTTASAESTTTASGPDPDAAWPSERESGESRDDLPTDEDGIIDADAREAARAESTDTGPDAGLDNTTTGAGTDTAPGGTALAGNADGATGGTPADPEGEPGDGRVVSTPDEDQPDISELREQLNDQFESIKILEPGQYELNLMELYDREEYIIALQENGRYVIQVPEQWLGDQPGEP